MSHPTPPTPPPPPVPAGPATRTPSGYEFSKAENEVIYNLARSQRSLGQLLAVMGVIALAIGLAFGYAFFVAMKPQPAQTDETRTAQLSHALKTRAVPAVLLVLVGTQLIPLGWWNLKAAGAFRRIVDTTGRDIPELMVALTALGKSYRRTFGLLVAPGVVAVVLLAILTFDLFK
jgi:hypothetical protein